MIVFVGTRLEDGREFLVSLLEAEDGTITGAAMADRENADQSLSGSRSWSAPTRLDLVVES